MRRGAANNLEQRGPPNAQPRVCVNHYFSVSPDGGILED